MPESVLLGRVCSKKKETHCFKCVRIKSFGYKLILSLVNLVLMIFVVSVVTVWVPWAFLSVSATSQMRPGVGIAVSPGL